MALYHALLFHYNNVLLFLFFALKITNLFVLLINHRLQLVFVIFDEDRLLLFEPLVLLFFAKLILKSLKIN